MGINRDFRDLFSELRAAEARFLFIGAQAVILRPRDCPRLLG